MSAFGGKYHLRKGRCSSSRQWSNVLSSLQSGTYCLILSIYLAKISGLTFIVRYVWGADWMSGIYNNKSNFESRSSSSDYKETCMQGFILGFFNSGTTDVVVLLFSIPFLGSSPPLKISWGLPSKFYPGPTFLSFQVLLPVAMMQWLCNQK